MNNASINSPACKGNRTVFAISFFTKDGREKRKIIATNNAVLKATVVGFTMCFLYTFGVDELEKWAKHEKSDSLRPTMEALAKNGQDEASLWLAKNYPQTELHRVTPLAEKGIPEAMLYQGFILTRAGDKNGAMLWIKKSADAGNEKAIEIIKSNANR